LCLVLDFIPPPVPLPPTNVVGIVCKNRFAAQSARVLEITWDPSPSPNVVSYRIYRNGILIAEVPAGGPLRFVDTRTSGLYQISAFNSFGNESVLVTVPILP